MTGTEDGVPKNDKRCYFFGWHLVNGIPFSMMWVEDDGIVVGGIPGVVEKMEITKEEFDKSMLSDLEKECPYPAKETLPMETPSEEPKPT